MSVSRHAAYNLAGSLIPLGLSLLTIPLYVGLVGAERYGVLAIAWLLLGYFGLFDLGLGRATSYRIASLRGAEPQARADTFWAAMAVNVAMGLVGGGVLWIASGLFFTHLFKVDAALRSEVLAAVPILAMSVPVATLSGVLSGALEGREKFLETNIISAGSACIFQILPLVMAWHFGPNLTLLLSGALASRFLAVIATAIRCHAHVTRDQSVRLKTAEVSNLLRYGGWVSLTSVFGPVLVVIDRFVIGATLGAAAVTTYSVPSQLASRLAVLPGALSTALFPRMSSAQDGERTALSNQAMLSLGGILCLPFVGGIFIFQPFLHLWIGDKLGPEAPLIGRVLIFGMWANALALISFAQLQASGRPDSVTKILLIEIPPYLLLLYFSSKYFGLTGCALAAAARYTADFVLLTLKAGPLNRDHLRLCAGFGILGLSVWTAGLWTIDTLQWWIAAGACCLLAFAFGAVVVPAEMRRLLVQRIRDLTQRD